jgi:hypothetical protein
LADALILLEADELGDAVVLLELVSETDCEEDADADGDTLELAELETDADADVDALGLAELETDADEDDDADPDTEWDSELVSELLALPELVGVAVDVDDAVAVDEKSGMRT